MADIADLLDSLDDDGDTAHDRLATIKSSIRFAWDSGPSTAWLEGHPARHDSWSVKLLSERTINLGEFHQFNLYAGMLAGLPTDTARFAADAVREANRLIPRRLPLLMLKPMFREFDSPASYGEPRRKLRVLPPIASVGVFVSSTLESAPNDVYSSLKVTWFQGAFGLPSDPYILEQMRNIDWEHEAESGMP